MSVDYAAKWVQNGNTFNFVRPYSIDGIQDGGFNLTVPEQSYSGSDGAYQDASYAMPRDLSIFAQMNATTPFTGQQLRDQNDLMAASFQKNTLGQLYVPSSDRFINARVTNVMNLVDGFGEGGAFIGLSVLKWRMGFRCADPYFYDTAPQSSVPLTIGGTTAFSVGGSGSALPIVTVNLNVTGPNPDWIVAVTLAPWASNYLMALPCIFTVPSTALGGTGNGTYTIDSTVTPHRVLYNGITDVSTYLSGQFLELPVGNNQITTSVATTLQGSGIDVSSVTAAIQWTRRWSTAL